jgi:Uma2 family endonuclease
MVVQERFYTAEELWAMSQDPANADRRFDLREGVLYEMPPAGWLHGDVTLEFAVYIRLFARMHQLGRVTTAETGFTLHKNPNGKDTVLAPDIGFIAAARIPAQLPDGYVPFAPDLAVEVISPSNTAEEISSKVELYLRYGTRLVWVLYPREQRIHVFRSSGQTGQATVTFLGIDDTLDGEDVLPGFSLRIADLFTLDIE